MQLLEPKCAVATCLEGRWRKVRTSKDRVPAEGFCSRPGAVAQASCHRQCNRKDTAPDFQGKGEKGV